MSRSPRKPRSAADAGGGVRTENLPDGIVFMPDATYGVVRSVGPDDLAAAGVRIVMTNSYHLSRRPGVTTVQALGGVKTMLGWDKPIATDSGGFQAYSIIRSNPKLGRVSRDGLVFSTEARQPPIRLTPEKAIQNQLRIGSDILFCLDDCTHAEADDSEQELSVERTIAWARRCKDAFERGVSQRRFSGEPPRLFAVVQGGRNLGLRRRCAEALLEIGFDGFGYGGWPIDEQGQLLADLLEMTRDLIPAELPMHALGVGHPASIVACAGFGYTLFDSALPTRDARRGRLYTFREAAPEIDRPAGEWLQFIYIDDDKHIKSAAPISSHCPCPVCQRFSRGYLRHLSQLEDGLFFRFATIHNLSFMRQLTDLISARLRNGNGAKA
ncbi:MAG TPA: tRNA guanosine(34) transglycosylase Tgt [Propylenella sp.]|nr:tRNA guanosine(34) transglycosylase Tgt [Propylenella sp.]